MICHMKHATGRFAVTCKCCKAHWTATIDPKAGQGLFWELGAAHHCPKFDEARARIGNYQLGTCYLKVEPITHDSAGSQHKCSDKCRCAKGGSCECSCGGMFHGAAYAA